MNCQNPKQGGASAAHCTSLPTHLVPSPLWSQ